MARFARYFSLAVCFAAHSAFAATNAGNTSTTLNIALLLENFNNGVINFDAGNVNLVEQVRAVQSDGTFTFVSGAKITINGMNNTLNGGGTTRGFFVGGRTADNTGSVTINNLTFNSCRAKGGDGNLGGGGGMGAGGGLYVGKNSIVIIEDCGFVNCSSQGGSSLGSVGRGGGGGLSGNGGGFGTPFSGSGGGGFGGSGFTGTGQPIGGGGGGASGFAAGNASGTVAGKNFDGGGASGSSGVGGDGSSEAPGNPGGFGGGGGGAGDGAGGNGGSHYGGGGSGTGSIGGAGGFGGGGGGGSTGGAGGFGGGGAGAATGGVGGFGAGDGTGTQGGKGAGFGGAIFIEDGGDLTIKWALENQSLFSGSSAAAGNVGTSNSDPNAGFGALGQDIFMMSGSSLTFDLTSDVILQNPIEGNQGDETPGASVPTNTGSLTKSGPALLSLTGDNTYTGTTIVEAGELRINSSVVSNIVVESGGTLTGSFDLNVDATGNHGGDLINEGLFSPGVDGLGQVNIAGTYTNESTGIFRVDITPTGNVNDKIIANSGADLKGGQLEVIVNEGNYIAGTQYEVIVGDVTGAFDNQDNPTQLGSDAGTIDILVTSGSLIITVLTDRIFQDQVVQSGVPQDVVDCIIASPITPGSDFATMVEVLGTLPNNQVNAALTSLSAVAYGSLEWINARNNSLSADILSEHLFELCCSPRDCCSCDCNSNAWVTVFGNLMNNKKRLDNLRKYNADAVGVLAGIDSCCGDRFYYGAAFGYTHTDLLWKNHGGKGNINSYYGALYGSWVCDCFSADLSVLGGGSDNDLKREIAFADVDRTARGDFWGYFVTTHLGFRSKGQWHQCFQLEPFALVDYHYYTHETFTEKGADSLNLRVKSKDQHMMRGEAGLLWYFEQDCECFCYAPYLGVSWVGEFSLHKSKQPASFVGQSCVIDATSYNADIHLGSPQAGVKWTHCNGASFSLGYKGLFNKCTHINQVEGRFEWVF